MSDLCAALSGPLVHFKCACFPLLLLLSHWQGLPRLFLLSHGTPTLGIHTLRQDTGVSLVFVMG